MHILLHHSFKATAFAIALAFTLAACGKSPEQHFQQAQELVRQSDLKAAVIELKSVLQEQPNNREARLLLGEVFLKNGLYLDAEKELVKARSLGAPDDLTIPQLAKAYVRMGEHQKALDLSIPATNLSAQSLAALYTMRAEAQLSLGKRALAEQSIGVANQAVPKLPELLLLRVKVALMDKQNELAGKLLDEVLQEDPKYIEALYFKAALLQSENKPDEVIKIYQRILANDPSQFRAHLAIAGLQMKKGDVDAADKAIQAAEKVAGMAPMVKYVRGTLELQHGKLDKAKSAFLDVLRVAPDHLPSVLAYAAVSYGLGDYEQSIKNAGKVLGAAPDNLIAAKLLTGSLLKTGDVKGALKTIDPLLAKHPNDAKLLALAGEIYLQSKDYNKAMGYLDKAAELDPENATIKTRQAAGHLATGDSNEALADLEKATSLSEKPGQTDLALVMLYMKDKAYDKALQAIASLEKKLPNNPVTHNLRAAALLGKQDKTGARKALEQALAIDPKFFPAAVNLARLDMQDKKPEAARKRFESVLAADKNNVKAMLALADLAATEKKEKDHVAWLEKAVKADPKAIQPRAGLVRHYLKNKENQKALAQSREANNANPDNLQAMNLLGATQFATGDNASAIATFSRMTQQAPQVPDAYLRLAHAQSVDKQLAAARESLKVALRLKPDFRAAQDALMHLELADNKPDAALVIARQIQSQLPQSPLGFEREADILLSQKRYPQAIKAYEQTLSRGAGTAGMIKLHRALIMAGDSKTADQRLGLWIKQHPNDRAARTVAAETYMLSKRNLDAIAQYEALLKSSPNDVIVLNNLAYLYQIEKDGRAAATAEKALKLAPGHPGVQDTLGWILVQQGQLPRALEILQKAASKLPKSVSVRYHYGAALARAGKKAEARKELEAAIASGRNLPELAEAKALLKSL